MNVVVVTPPPPLLTAAQAAAHLRLDTAEEADYLNGLIAAAQGTVDGPMGWLGRSLGLQTLELRTADFGGLVLPCGPVVDLVSVVVIAATGAIVVLDPATCILDAEGGLRPAAGQMWPSVQLRADAVRVRYRAGYPDAEDGTPTVPAGIVHAVKVMVGLLYENRTAAADLQMHPTVMSLLSPFRVWGF